MSVMEFIVGLTRALAWPLIVLLIVLVLRRPISELLRTRLTRFEGLGFKAEFGRVSAAVRAEVQQATAQPRTGERTSTAGEAPPISVAAELVGLVDCAPADAVLRAHETLIADLRQRLAADGFDSESSTSTAPEQLAAIAAKRGVITSASAESVYGLTMLRNLAVGSRRDVTPGQALEFITMVDAILYSFRQSVTP